MKLDQWCAAVGFNLYIQETWNPREDHYQFVAHIQNGMSHISEFVAGGSRSICGWGSTREEALADLAQCASEKKIVCDHGSREYDVEAPQLEWEAVQEEVS